MPSAQSPPLRIAIIGGGPGGLSSAIFLSRLPNTTVTLYEQAKELREIGAGIQIGANCWKVLELLGAAEGVIGHRNGDVLRLNGLTGEVIHKKEDSGQGLKRQPMRVRRTRLQAALKTQVPDGMIKLNKRLSTLQTLGSEGVRITFEHGEQVIADLVVGGDGIRSVVRQHLFPSHSIQFTGTTIFRVLIPATSVAHISGLTPATSWWFGPAGHVYFSLVDDPSDTVAQEQKFEIAARNVVDSSTAVGKRFSWGVGATKERVEGFFRDYDPRVREALSKVEEGQWREFSAFAGPRLERLHGWEGKVVLIGDASHPLSGAFGSGAAFAMEDSYILARAIEHTRSSSKGLAAALDIFDDIRSPYYKRMYEHLDQDKRRMQDLKAVNPNAGFEFSLKARLLGGAGEEKLSWIYGNDIEEIWRGFAEDEKRG